MNDLPPTPPRTEAEHPALDFDAELRLYNELLREACGVGRRDQVVDIGCGRGQTTREAARLAVDGAALGVDLYDTAVAEARRLAREDGLPNVTFECADAQVHAFPDQRFDVAISRFGTMFFHDPAAAFANIHRALRPTGRLVMLVWQAKERNDWAVGIEQVFAAHGASTTVDGAGPNAFSLGDPATTTAMLHAAGFADVTFADVRRPVYYGHDTETALGWIHGFATARQALTSLDPSATEHALDDLRAMVTRHLGADGVWFDSSAWIVTATSR